MILTGKAKEDFIYHYYNRVNFEIESIDYYSDFFEYSLEETHKLSSIVEWFDSVGIFIGIEPYLGGGQPVFYTDIIYRNEDFIDVYVKVENHVYNPVELYFDTRLEAIKESITKANQIYNEKHLDTYNTNNQKYEIYKETSRDRSNTMEW